MTTSLQLVSTVSKAEQMYQRWRKDFPLSFWFSFHMLLGNGKADCIIHAYSNQIHNESKPVLPTL